jgi:hypothetical protein
LYQYNKNKGFPFACQGKIMPQIYLGIKKSDRRSDSFLLHAFTFAILFPAKKQACGPEARALRGKSIGGKRNPFGDPPLLPQNEAGPSGAPPGAPTSGYPGS